MKDKKDAMGNFGWKPFLTPSMTHLRDNGNKPRFTGWKSTTLTSDTQLLLTMKLIIIVTAKKAGINEPTVNWNQTGIQGMQHMPIHFLTFDL